MSSQQIINQDSKQEHLEEYQNAINLEENLFEMCKLEQQVYIEQQS